MLATAGPKVVSSSPPTVPATSTPLIVAAPPTTPLPAPDALIDVLNRLADPNVPGTNKVNLVEGATPESAGTLDKFINALRDNGYLPMTFAANNIAWSDKNPSHVMATVTVNTAQPNNPTSRSRWSSRPSKGVGSCPGEPRKCCWPWATQPTGTTPPPGPAAQPGARTRAGTRPTQAPPAAPPLG